MAITFKDGVILGTLVLFRILSIIVVPPPYLGQSN